MPPVLPAAQARGGLFHEEAYEQFREEPLEEAYARYVASAAAVIDVPMEPVAFDLDVCAAVPRERLEAQQRR